MYKITEKRKYERMKTPYIIRFRVKPNEAENIVSKDWDAVHLDNLGAKGAFFYTRRSLETGTILDLKLKLSDSIPSIQCIGRVIRSKRHLGTSIFGIAIEFIETDEHIKGSFQQNYYSYGS